jgi:hypothetical protein
MSTVTNSTPQINPLNVFLDSNIAKVGVKGPEPFPIVDKLWDVFAGKGIRTVFLSIGTSKSPLADLEISESLGCPLHVCALNAAEKESWLEVSTILKERKREPSASSFTELVDTKWILPKNLRVMDSLPWYATGTMDLSGSMISTQNLDVAVTSICSTMKLKDTAKRIDVLKIDTTVSAPGLEVPLIYTILSAGYRPSVLIVKWSAMPDTDLTTTLVAGHLQCCGYTLLSAIDDKFLYYFSDDNLYEICSWEKRTTMNPIAQEILKANVR